MSVNYSFEHRRAPTLKETHKILESLYRAEYPKGAPQLFEQLVPRFPYLSGALIRNKLKRIIKAETGADQSHDKLSSGDKQALSMFLDPQVRTAYLELGRDFALSNDHHSISHFDTQPPLVANDLIRVAAGENSDNLTKMGCVFFDVDGTKTLVDCTSHAHAGKYLEGLAEFLSKLSTDLKQWLQEHELHAEAFTVAGDEFVVVLRSEVEPIDKDVLDEFATKVQSAIAEDTYLTSFVSFDDPDFIMEYDEWSDEDRASYNQNSEAMNEKMAASRATLPEKFIPSVSCGSATLIEALHEALSPDTEEANTLEELGVNTFRLMVARADARMKEDKRIFRESLQDSKWKEFLLRNGENRRLERELQAAKEKIDALQQQLNQQLRVVTDEPEKMAS